MWRHYVGHRMVALSTSRSRCTIGPMPEADPLHPVTPRDERLLPWRAFLVAHARITRRLDEELRAEHDLTLGEYDALLALAETRDRRLRMNTLAERVILSKSGVTRLIDRLVADGLVVRDQCVTDARGAEAVLTDKGLERLRRASRTHLRGIERSLLRGGRPGRPRRDPAGDGGRRRACRAGSAPDRGAGRGRLSRDRSPARRHERVRVSRLVPALLPGRRARRRAAAVLRDAARCGRAEQHVLPAASARAGGDVAGGHA